MSVTAITTTRQLVSVSVAPILVSDYLSVTHAHSVTCAASTQSFLFCICYVVCC